MDNQAILFLLECKNCDSYHYEWTCREAKTNSDGSEQAIFVCKVCGEAREVFPIRSEADLTRDLKPIGYFDRPVSKVSFPKCVKCNRILRRVRHSYIFREKGKDLECCPSCALAIIVDLLLKKYNISLKNDVVSTIINIEDSSDDS